MAKKKTFDSVVDSLMMEAMAANSPKAKRKAKKADRADINSGMGQTMFLDQLKNAALDRQEERDARSGTAPSPWAAKAHESTMELYDALGRQIKALGPKEAPLTP